MNSFNTLIRNMKCQKSCYGRLFGHGPCGAETLSVLQCGRWQKWPQSLPITLCLPFAPHLCSSHRKREGVKFSPLVSVLGCGPREQAWECRGLAFLLLSAPSWSLGHGRRLCSFLGTGDCIGRRCALSTEALPSAALGPAVRRRTAPLD